MLLFQNYLCMYGVQVVECEQLIAARNNSHTDFLKPLVTVLLFMIQTLLQEVFINHMAFSYIVTSMHKTCGKSFTFACTHLPVENSGACFHSCICWCTQGKTCRGHELYPHVKLVDPTNQTSLSITVCIICVTVASFPSVITHKMIRSNVVTMLTVR